MNNVCYIVKCDRKHLFKKIKSLHTNIFFSDCFVSHYACENVRIFMLYAKTFQFHMMSFQIDIHMIIPIN